MNENIYNKSITCPVCQKKIEITKLKSNSYRIISKDSDFFPTYEGENPMFYDVWICEFCGYAAQNDKFTKIFDTGKKLVKKAISPRWKKRSFCGERNIDIAIETFKLALVTLIETNSKASDIAKVTIRIAWLYRIKNKKIEELNYLNHSLNYYISTYTNESFPAGKLNEITCIYMIAELNRRLNQFKESLNWFNKFMSKRTEICNPELIDTAREMIYLIREEYNEKV